ncbi:hypothetical protein J2X14_000013 [Pantoea alhagi]|uniref:DUF1120 domain-containing protein n=1 Tax=Mixta sp. BE291 TaxID=3158787 RepID=UPI002859F832|nr:hypothetical protein [Pantoea alhagi]
MNKVTTLSCALSLLAMLPGSLAAAPTAEIKIIGTIVPSACQLALTNNGLLDYGKIAASSLKKDAFTPLGALDMNINITCDAPMRVAIIAKSGRGASAVNKEGGLGEMVDPGITLGGISPGKAIAAGLGVHNGVGIGGYAMAILPASHEADNKPARLLASSDASGWAVANIRQPLLYEKTSYFSWTNDGKQPTSHTVFTGGISVQAYINKTSELDVSKEVKLDGLATLELIYL